MLVTRGTAAGMAAALQAITRSHQLGHYRPSLVLLADGPWPAPPQARARLRLRLLRDPQRLRITVELPYVLAWRDVDDPLTGAPPSRAYRNAVDQLAAALLAAGTTATPDTTPASVPAGADVRTSL